jgi:hypothetical protein
MKILARTACRTSLLLPETRVRAPALIACGASVLALLPATAAAAMPARAAVVAPSAGLASPTVATPVSTSSVAPIVVRTSGGITLGRAPDAPGLYPLQPMSLAVTIRWYDRSTNEQKFILFRRDVHGAWREIYEVPTSDVAGGGDYTYVDTDRSMSGQCYKIAAVNAGGGGETQEECTVRPDSSRFPQQVPSAVEKWDGLSNVNDGTGGLETTGRDFDTSLNWSHQTFGISLDWSDTPSLWKIEAQGGPQLMQGQAVALRVWGGGWLTYGFQSFGVQLQLSDTPSYEWYIVGGTPGSSISSNGSWALWNSAAHDYLVEAHRSVGASLRWYQETLPPPPAPLPRPPVGVKTVQATNCVDEQRPLEMWVDDLTARTATDSGTLDSQYADGGCPATGQPWMFTPTSGHQYVVYSVDYSAPGCSNDPTIADCWRSQTTFTGDAGGGFLPIQIG